MGSGVRGCSKTLSAGAEVDADGKAGFAFLDRARAGTESRVVSPEFTSNRQLLPVPFLLTSLGIPFLILATILNVGWLVLGILGYKIKDDIKWAKLMFVYSLQYLTIIFVAMVIVTLV